ncbi:hypothetical protein SAMN05444173_2270 [Opitutus sp. GAS368]|nr:hypothetical protein SAMN05444173_2270 [Opitutus sp. GAS368]
MKKPGGPARLAFTLRLDAARSVFKPNNTRLLSS